MRTLVELVNAFDYYGCPFCIDFHVYSSFTVVFSLDAFSISMFYFQTTGQKKKRALSGLSEMTECYTNIWHVTQRIYKAECPSITLSFIFSTL